MFEQQMIEQPKRDVLEEGWLHHALVFFHTPERLAGWMILLLSLLIPIPAGLAWLLVTNDVRTVVVSGLCLWLFSAADLIILLTLPRRRISFGPWKAQFFALSLPRMAAAVALGLAALWIGWKWSMLLTLIIQMIGTIALIWGAFVEPFRLRLSEQTMTTDRLPAGIPPIRLLHISDLHVERLTRREEMVLSLIEMAKPDLIVITGDYVNLSYNRDPETYAQLKQLLGRLSAPYGVYATLGSPPVDVRDTITPLFENLPVMLLRDEWATVNMGAGRELVLVGLDCSHHIPSDQARLDRVMGIAPNSVPQVLLYHSPELMPQASEHQVDLYLCGHTHGGQVRLPFIGPILTSSQLGRKYVMGLYRNGRTHLYVSRGVGLEGLSAPRVRFLAPPEITLFNLQGC